MGGGEVRVLGTHHVRGRGKVIGVELGDDCALCVLGARVRYGSDSHTIVGIERDRANRPLAPGDLVGLLLRPEPWGESDEIMFAQDPCSFCHGTGFNDRPALCRECRGAGREP